MKNVKFNTVIMLLLSFLCISCLAGCGGGRNSGGEASSTQIQDDPNKDNFIWTLDDDGNAVIQSFIGQKYADVVVPETVIGEAGYNEYVNDQTEHTVVGIQAWGDTEISSVEFPETITYINEFTPNYYGDDLKFPDSLLEIGDRAFSESNYMGTLVLPKNLETIGEYAFSDSKITGTLTLPEKTINIGDFAFSGCSGLDAVNISPALKTIPNGFLERATGLTGTLKIPEGINVVGDAAFRGCTNVTSISFPASLREIGEESFSGCTSTTGTLSLPNNLFVVNSAAFGTYNVDGTLYACGFTGKIIVPASVKEIGKRAFDGCVHADSVKIQNKNVDASEIIETWKAEKKEWKRLNS